MGAGGKKKALFLLLDSSVKNKIQSKLLHPECSAPWFAEFSYHPSSVKIKIHCPLSFQKLSSIQLSTVIKLELCYTGIVKTVEDIWWGFIKISKIMIYTI